MDGSENAPAPPLDPVSLRLLLRLLEASDIDELEAVHGHSRIYVRRQRGRPATDAHERSVDRATGEGIAITAPLTGVYYSRAAPDQPYFVSPGAMIEPGQVVALIETMKLFNEVTADCAGEVLSIVAQHGDLVEAGQPLIFMRLREEGDQS
jgi:acetyl-CoA carboxylase biotin carboxyl carrier protein